MRSGGAKRRLAVRAERKPHRPPRDPSIYSPCNAAFSVALGRIAADVLAKSVT